MKDTLGVSRSNLVDRLKHDGQSCGQPRRRYRKPGVAALLPRLRRLVDERPTYGYRRLTALLNRELAAEGRAPVNHKQVNRLARLWLTWVDAMRFGVDVPSGVDRW